MTKGNNQDIEKDLLGAYAAHPIKIASVFSGYCLEEGIKLPQSIKDGLIASRVKYGEDEKAWQSAVSYFIEIHQKPKFKAHNLISKSIHIFCQTAKQKANGQKELLQKIDIYRDRLFDWLKQGLKDGKLDIFERDRLIMQRQSLIDNLPKQKNGKGETLSARQKVKERRDLLKEVIEKRTDIDNDAPALADCNEIKEYEKYYKKHFNEKPKRDDLIQTIRNDLKNINR